MSSLIKTQNRIAAPKSLRKIPKPLPPNTCAVRAADRNKIYRRAEQLVAKREASSGLAHLKKEDREKIEALRGGVRLVQIASEHRADELAASLHTEFPWLAAATEIVWQG